MPSLFICKLEGMKAGLEDIRHNLLALLEAQRTDMAAQLLGRWVQQAETIEATQRLLSEVVNHLPSDSLQTPKAIQVYAKLLCSARQPEALLNLWKTKKAKPKSLGVYVAWAMIQSRQSQRALQLLQDAQDTTAEHGLLWRFRAEAMAALGIEGWQEAFAKARSHLSGGALGRCLLEEGNCLYRLGERAAARGVWSEALSHLHHDAFYSAWLRHSLGITILTQDPVEAENHLLITEQLSRKRAARGFRARALCGLGAVRRVMGEWERAISSYKAALAAATEADDQREALWGIGHSYRLSGRPIEAIPFLLRAHEVDAQPSLWLDIAAAHLMLGNRARAKEALAKAKGSNPKEIALAGLLKAELARLSGQAAWAARVPTDIDYTAAWIQQEQACFPQLFAGLPKSLRIAKPASSQPMRIEVEAAGILRVRVNGREVPLDSTSRAAEVLILLMEGKGEATIDQLIDALYRHSKDDSKSREKARQAVWAHLQKLRQVLGWQQSVTANNGVYRLDGQAHWEYDMHKRGAKRKKQFLEGVYSLWVMEKREMLFGTM